MTLKTEPIVSIEHRLMHRIHYQHQHQHHIDHHHHFHVNHQLLIPHHNHQHNHHHHHPIREQEQEHQQQQQVILHHAITENPQFDGLQDENQTTNITATNIATTTTTATTLPRPKLPPIKPKGTRSNHVISSVRRDQQINATAGTKNRQSEARPRQRSQVQFILMAAFAYVLSPIDLIPEAIFGIFGILDDILFLLMCLLCIATILLYPLFREMRNTILDKLGLRLKPEMVNNKNS